MDAIIEYLVKNFGVAGLIAIVVAWIWLDLRRALMKMADSLTTLTTQLAIVVERVDSHEKRLDRIEDKQV